MARRPALHHRARRAPVALRLLLALCACPALFAPAALAQEDDDFSEVEIETTKVAGSVYMLEGAGGNIAASVGEDGIVIVDDQFAPLADKIRAALVELGITDKPVRFVINTHYHSDHVGGNASFSRTAAIIAHDNVRERLIAVEPAGNGGSIRFDNEPVEKDALPVITFAQDVTIHVNGDDIRALHFPAGHTDGDAIVFFTQSNVVHMGDDFVRYGFPFIDVASGGSVHGMIEANEKLIEQLPSDVKVIPGHGALSSLEDIRAFVRMLEETSAVVEKAIAAGKTVEQMKEEKILEPWKQWSGEFINADAFIETLHASLTRGPGARFRKHN
jgi:glyoxylase-like metal-dependent hydrolase (beta-lactamase superfamily II)